MKTKVIEFRKGDKQKYMSAMIREKRKAKDVIKNIYTSGGGPKTTVITDYNKSEFYVRHVVAESQDEAEITIYDSGEF